MYVSQTAEYALRAMSYLANRGEADGGVRAADLAQEVSVPLAYLQKILRRMVVAGLLESRKGHGGGFRLIVSPQEVTFGDVLRAADFDLVPGHCAFGWNDCDPENPCPLHPAWSRLNDSITEWAESSTLSDVVVGRDGRRPAKRDSE
jgi:Rrf2 family protein